jgi:L-malate glycosyltransferase
VSPHEGGRLLFVGAMLGGHPGRVVSQGETVASLLASAGRSARQTSSVRHPLARAAAVTRDMVRWRHDVDIVVVSVYSGRAFAHADLASQLARALGKAVVLWLHGGDLPAFADRHRRWFSRVMARGDRVVAPSAYLAEAFPAMRRGTRVIPNVVAVDTYPYRERAVVAPRLLWMRAFEDLYRPGLALDVLARVRRVVPEATLTMAGQDSGRLAAVKAEAAGRGLADSVRFPGYLDEVAKRDAFAAHDVFLTTSRVDNMPVSVLEAAACGLPVVAFPVGGLEHLLTHEHDALLPADGDAEAMAHAVLRLFTEPGLAGRLSRHGRELARGCDWPIVRDQWDDLLAGLPGLRPAATRRQ